MKKYKIKIDVESCIGCGICSALNNNFVLDEKTGKAKIKKQIITEKELKEYKEIAEACPVGAITIKEIND